MRWLSSSRSQRGNRYPDSASNINIYDRNVNQYGVEFDISPKAFSYEYFNGIKNHLIDNGYTGCRLSDISEWQDLPMTNGGDKWLVLMLSNKIEGNFALLRVVQSKVTKSGGVNQHFTVAIQHVVKSNEGNVKGFCGD